MGYSPGAANASAIEHIISTFLVRQSFMSLIATYSALPRTTQNRNDISGFFFFFFFQGSFRVNNPWTAAGLPPGSASLAYIQFLLPAGGAEKEIWGARADVAAGLSLACVGTCCSDDGFCCALLTGRLKDVVGFMTTQKLTWFPAYPNSTSCFDLSGAEHF